MQGRKQLPSKRASDVGLQGRKQLPSKRASNVGLEARKQQASKAAPLSRVLGAVAKTNKFKCKDDALREALYNYHDTPARTPEWALKVIDSVYKAAAALVRGMPAVIIGCSSDEGRRLAIVTDRRRGAGP